MNIAPRPSARPNTSLPYVTRARARRLEREDIQQRAEQREAGRCACGLPATVGDECATCERAHKAAVKSAFVGL